MHFTAAGLHLEPLVVELQEADALVHGTLVPMVVISAGVTRQPVAASTMWLLPRPQAIDDALIERRSGITERRWQPSAHEASSFGGRQ